MAVVALDQGDIAILPHLTASVQCSSKCGGGEQFRKVRCQQLLSLGQVIDKPDEQCKGDVKPEKEEGCNTQDCVYSDTPEIKANLDQDYMQTDPYLKVKNCQKLVMLTGLHECRF